jgi:hypothetical protein
MPSDSKRHICENDRCRRLVNLLARDARKSIVQGKKCNTCKSFAIAQSCYRLESATTSMAAFDSDPSRCRVQLYLASRLGG